MSVRSSGQLIGCASVKKIELTFHGVKDKSFRGICISRLLISSIVCSASSFSDGENKRDRSEGPLVVRGVKGRRTPLELQNMCAIDSSGSFSIYRREVICTSCASGFTRNMSLSSLFAILNLWERSNCSRNHRNRSKGSSNILSVATDEAIFRSPAVMEFWWNDAACCFEVFLVP